MFTPEFVGELISHHHDQMRRDFPFVADQIIGGGPGTSCVYAFVCGPYVKIGHSDYVWTRVEQLRKRHGDTFTPDDLPSRDDDPGDLIAAWPGGADEERQMHARLAHQRGVGEWFHFNEFTRAEIAKEAHRHLT